MLQRGQQTGNVPRAQGAPPGLPQGLEAWPRQPTLLGLWWARQDPHPSHPAPPPSCTRRHVALLSCLLLPNTAAVHITAGEAPQGWRGPCVPWWVRPGIDGSSFRGCPRQVPPAQLCVVPGLKPLLCQGLHRWWEASSFHGDTRAARGSGPRGTAVRCRASLGQQGCSCINPTATGWGKPT